MLDEIYFRLLLELAPDAHKLSNLDTDRVILNYGKTEEAREAYGTLVRSIYESEPGSHIGLEYGKLLRPHALCDFSRALMTAPDFDSTMQIINDLHYMQGASYFLSAHKDAHCLSISLCYPYKKSVGEEQRRFCAEAVFTYIVNLVRDAMGSDIHPSHMSLDYSEPNYSLSYDDFYQCSIDYDSKLSVLEFPIELSSRPLNTANTILHNTYLKKCIDSVRRAEKHWSFDYRAITKLMRNHPNSFNGNELATNMNISPRGLQKRLSSVGTSFSTLASHVRFELAKVYLIQHGYSLEQTSELLGFQTVSGFRRYFKSETNTTISEFLGQAKPPSAIH